MGLGIETGSEARRRVDAALVLGIGAAAGGPLAVAPFATAAGAVLVAFLFRRAAGAMAALALVLLGVSGARARSALDEARAAHAAAAASLSPPRRCEAVATVKSSPVVHRDGQAREGGGSESPDGSDGSGAEPRASAEVDLEALACEGEGPGREALSSLGARLFGLPEDARRGDRFRVVVDIAATQLFLHAELRSPFARAATRGVVASGSVVVSEPEAAKGDLASRLASLVDGARARARARIEATFHPEAAPLARALVLGEVDLSREDDVAFRESGLSHLLAVSGTHLVVAVASIYLALRALLVRVPAVAARVDPARLAAAACLPLAFLYADFSGGSGSARRAALMLAAAFLARALGRRQPGARALGLSLLAGSILDPLAALDASFTLSAGATAGLLALSRPLEGALSRGAGRLGGDGARGRKVLASIATTLAATLGCAPVLAGLSPSLPILGVAANVVAAPIGELVALPICLLHAALGFLPGPGSLEAGCALVGSGALLTVRAVARASGSASAAGLALFVPDPTPMQLAVLAGLLASLTASPPGLRPRALRLSVFAGLLSLLELFARAEGRPEGRLRITVLDVGQGDALLVDLPDGSALLVDGGGAVGPGAERADPGARVVAPLLRARRRDRLAAVVLSHPHPDHFGGLAAATARASVAELWDSGQGEAEGARGAYAALLEGLRERGTRVLGPALLCGAPRDFGGATVEVLAPCPAFDPDHGPNDNSLVLRIAYGRRVALLVGDAEREEEAHLLRFRRADLAADFLKVGHHGSLTSTTAPFLDAVSPEVAAISCGVRNRFGHPHPDVLARLESRGVPVHRTDRGGAIVWETDGKHTRLLRP